MLIREIIQSTTLLSLLQLVFSERAAQNMYSYFRQQAPMQIEIGAAFTLLKNPINRKLYKGRNHIGKVWKYGESWTASTHRNLFFLNFHDIGKGKETSDPVERSFTDEENVSLNDLPWSSPEVSPQKSDFKTMNLRSSFGLSSLINVEALLLTSGQDMSVQEDENMNSATLLNDMTKQNPEVTGEQTVPSNLTAIDYISNAEDQLTWDALMLSIQKNFKEIVESPTGFSPSFEFSMAAEVALKEATQSIEEFMNEATSSLSPEKVQSMIISASRSLAINQNADVFKTVMDQVVAAAEILARDQGVDVSEAAAQARATTKYTTEFLQVANGVLVSGYVRGGRKKVRDNDLAKELNIPTTEDIVGKPLFHDFSSIETITDDEYQSVIEKGSEMALLSGAIYQETVQRTHKLGHAIVANGISADVAWMVSDKIDYETFYKSSQEINRKDEPPILVRTITIRGFDASDETVDRERLLNQICNAESVSFGDGTKIKVHKGLFEVAKELYREISRFIDMTGPTHKIVLNGHSIGGSLAVLVLYLLVEEKGADFVNDKVLRVFTFGSPPISTPIKDLDYSKSDSCGILKSFSVTPDKVYGYIQPWDPIVRMFSRIDPLYPLIGDLGDDGITLYASGPARTLRPVTRAILEGWKNWPKFRDDYKDVFSQKYHSVGVQHLLMPDTGRYLSDRLVSVNVATFPIDDVLRVAPVELYQALEKAFPLDTFTISLVPTAIRSFIHHFYPAYTDFATYSKKRKSMIDSV